ncbi:nucleoside hydrolase, partial [Burkholderia anthina]|uniref:nucleoside hydrolase n=1 Tax=Burkholderia anthina TaxID=179879 RepID=UPI00158A050E
DDAIAILFALGASDRLDVRALTAVAGNVPLELTERNARIIRDWAGRTRTLPVYAGCPRPLMRELITAANVHGKTGLEGVELRDALREIVLMGGAFLERGNITPAAEFNVYVDPEAARIVLASGVSIVVLPRDVAVKAPITPARIEPFRALGNRCGKVVA